LAWSYSLKNWRERPNRTAHRMVLAWRLAWLAWGPRVCPVVLLLPSLLKVASAEQVEQVELLQRKLLLSKAVPLSAALEDALPLKWVHFPKAGSSFLNVLVNLPTFCPRLKANTSVRNHSSFGSDFLENFLEQCPALCDWTKFHCDVLPHECLGDRYEVRKGSLVGMFRQPEQRLLSAFYDERNIWYFFGTPPFEDERSRNKSFVAPGPPPLDVWVQLFKGTAAYQLVASGVPNPSSVNFHAIGNPWELPERTMDMAREAAKRVREGFAFVGITEQWDLSICLFHAMFGGPCLAVEFEDTRSTLANKSAEDLYDTAPLQGFKDHVDGLVYQEALRVFSDNVQKYNVSFETCRHTCFGPAFG